MLFRCFLPFFLCILFASCVSYQTLNIDVLVPAKHSFRPELKSVVLVDNSIPFRNERVKGGIDTVRFDDYSSIAMKALKDDLGRRKFFDSVYIHPKPIKTEGGSINRPLSWLQVDSLCNIYNAEAIIAFEKNTYDVRIKATKLPGGNLLGYVFASGAILWRGYDNLNDELVYMETQRDVLSWSGLGKNNKDLALQLPSARASLSEMAKYQGAKATDHIAPDWKSEERGYYASGNYSFVQAAKWVRKEKWGEAIKVWKYVFDHSSKKTKARSAYNLAIASEILGDYESSVYWLNEGLSALNTYRGQAAAIDKVRMMEYSTYMKKRIKEIEVLKKQVGGIE